MAILLTDGTGKTSVRLAHLLQDAKIPFLLASRRAETASPPGMPAVKFDWLDESTFENPFQYKLPGNEKISAIYLISPQVFDPDASMNTFIDIAIKKYDVKRLVLMTGSLAEQRSGHGIGKVWQHLANTGVEYCVLRATWFMVTIRDEGKLYTACGDGKIPFVSAADISAVAFHTLTDEKLLATDYRVLGPELLTHDEVAVKLSKELGREIVHVRLSEEETVQRYMNFGMPEQVAQFMTGLELASAKGTENMSSDAVEKLTGRSGGSFDAWAHDNKKAWE